MQYSAPMLVTDTSHPSIVIDAAKAPPASEQTRKMNIFQTVKIKNTLALIYWSLFSTAAEVLLVLKEAAIKLRQCPVFHNIEFVCDALDHLCIVRHYQYRSSILV